MPFPELKLWCRKRGVVGPRKRMGSFLETEVRQHQGWVGSIQKCLLIGLELISQSGWLVASLCG